MTLGGANVWTNFSYGYRNESPSGWLLSPDRSRLILFTRNKKSPRSSMRIFAHTYNPIKKKPSKADRKISIQDPSKLLAEFFNGVVIELDEEYKYDS